MLKRDKKRLQGKGLGLIVATAIAVTFFYKWMDFMRFIWPTYMEIKTKYEMNPFYHIAIYTNSQHIFIYVFGNFILYFIYTGKYEIFEKERSR